MKRIICTIITITFLLQIFPAFSKDDSSVQIPQSPDMLFAKAVGILTDDVLQTDTLTRAELAKIFYRIVMKNSTTQPRESKYFSDVSYEMAPYTDFAYETGIIKGTAGGVFSPDSLVTYAQLLKTVVSFLGYAPYAEAKGGYPYGYIDVANSMDIFVHNLPSTESIVTVNLVASVFRLASSVSIAQRVSYGSDRDVSYSTQGSSDYLETYMGIRCISGQITANYLTSFCGEALSYGEVKIDDIHYKLTSDTANMNSYLGYNVTAWCDEDEIIWYEVSELNNEITIDSEDIIALNGLVLTYGDDKKINLSAGIKCIYNAGFTSSFDADILIPFETKNLEGSVKFLDTDNDRYYDVAIVDAYKSYVVKSVSNNVIFNEFEPSDTLNLGESFNDGDIEISNISGNPISVSDIAAGDIINVSKDISGRVKRIVVTIDNYSGILETIDKSQNRITIDGNEYALSKSVYSNPLSDYHSLTPGIEISIYFNKDAKISHIKKGSLRYKIAYLCAVGESGRLDSEYMLKLFTQKGEFEERSLAQKLRVGENMSLVAAKKVIEDLPKDTGGSVRQPVLYTTNSDGKINHLDYCTGTTPRNGIYVIDGFDNSGETIYHSLDQSNFGGRLIVDDTSVIFNVPKDSKADDWENYYIEASNYFAEGDIKINFTAYGITEDNSPCAAIVVRKDGVKNVSNNSDLFVVDTITQVSADGGEMYKITGYMSGALRTYYADIDDLSELFGSDDIKCGDVLQTRIINNKITKAKKLFDADSRSFESGQNPTQSDFENASRCVYGKVTYCDGTYIRIKLADSDTTEVYSLVSFKLAMVDFTNSRAAAVCVADAGDIYDEKYYPGYASDVLIHTRKGDARTIVVYNGTN